MLPWIQSYRDASIKTTHTPIRTHAHRHIMRVYIDIIDKYKYIHADTYHSALATIIEIKQMKISVYLLDNSVCYLTRLASNMAVLLEHSTTVHYRYRTIYRLLLGILPDLVEKMLGCGCWRRPPRTKHTDRQTDRQQSPNVRHTVCLLAEILIPGWRAGRHRARSSLVTSSGP